MFEEMEIVHLVEENYNLSKVTNISINNRGWWTHYVVETMEGKFFLKMLDMSNKNYNLHDEINMCAFLYHNGLRQVSRFIKNKKDEFITSVNNRWQFHIQKFIEGDVWDKNTGPEWLLYEGIVAISKVHSLTKTLKLRRRSSVERINDKEYHIARIESIEEKILELDDPKMVLFCKEDLKMRRTVIENQKLIDLDRLTYVNGHSDYSITQLITCNNQINGMIDFSETSQIPAVWEIIRFYTDSAPECRYGKINNDILNNCLSLYKQRNSLNEYDCEKIFELSYYYFCQAVSVYEKLIETRNQKFLNRAFLRRNRIQSLKGNINLLSKKAF